MGTIPRCRDHVIARTKGRIFRRKCSYGMNSMDRTQQSKAVDESSPHHDDTGEGGTGSGSPVEFSLSAAIARQRALTSQLMEQVVKSDNLNQAYAKVLANKGSPGIDRMRVDQLADWIRKHKQQFIESLLDGSYEPRPVRGVIRQANHCRRSKRRTLRPGDSLVSENSCRSSSRRNTRSARNSSRPPRRRSDFA